jgi:hypothetical protein
MPEKMSAEEMARELKDVYDGDHPQASAARERITQAFAALEFQLDKRAASWLEYQEALERSEEALRNSHNWRFDMTTNPGETGLCAACDYFAEKKKR